MKLIIELEKITGKSISRQAIASWESEDGARPDYENLIALSKIYGASVDYLLGLSIVRTSDVDIKKISEILNLSEDSIDMLKFIGDSFPEDLDLFLSYKYFGNLITTVSDAVQGDYIPTDIKGYISLYDEAKAKGYEIIPREEWRKLVIANEFEKMKQYFLNMCDDRNNSYWKKQR